VAAPRPVHLTMRQAGRQTGRPAGRQVGRQVGRQSCLSLPPNRHQPALLYLSMYLSTCTLSRPPAPHAPCPCRGWPGSGGCSREATRGRAAHAARPRHPRQLGWCEPPGGAGRGTTGWCRCKPVDTVHWQCNGSGSKVQPVGEPAGGHAGAIRRE
jgi:hypothetical protein